MPQTKSLRHLAALSLLPPLRLWRWLRPNPALRIITLHDVPAEQERSLERLLDLLMTRHEVVGPERAKGILTGGAAIDGRRNPYLITFDDGFHSNFRVAKRLLAPRGIRAVFFICPALVDLPASAQRQAIVDDVFARTIPADAIRDDLRLMTWEEIAQLAADGHEIGSHTLTHRRLSSLAPSVLEEEIRGSSERIVQHLKRKPEWFAYPFGDMASISRAACSAAASTYMFSCTAVRGKNRDTSSFTLTREHVDLDTPFAYLSFVAEGGFDPLYRSHRRTLRRWSDEVSGSGTGRNEVESD